MLARRLIQDAESQEHVERVIQARNAVLARPPITDVSSAVSDPGDELSTYLDTFRSQTAFQPFATEGWEVKIADLTKVCALQPMVFWDHAEERTQPAVIGDMLSLAAVTLPIRKAPESLPLQFDPVRNTWMVASRNPNLRIIGQFNAPINDGNGQTFTGCGFLIAISPSFVQVIKYRGRYLLRDGYHRSIGLLSRGMTHAPVLYREFTEFQPLGLGPGMLPEQSYLGDRPPMLADYLSETVSAEIHAPASQKMVVIQGMEMNPLG